MNIGATIAKARKAKGLSQTDLAARLSLLGNPITNQAICKWESNYTMPNARQLIMLCAVLEIEDVMGEFTNGKFGPFTGLNDEGREMMSEYHQLLLDTSRYNKNSTYTLPEPREVLRKLPLYSLAVSAGTGEFLDDDNYELIEVGSEVPKGADFGVRVAGDSMEPEFHDGQIIWIHQQRNLMTGDIGIFSYDGCSYLKQLTVGDNCLALHSLNPKYKDIAISTEIPLYVFGKVCRQ